MSATDAADARAAFAKSVKDLHNFALAEGKWGATHGPDAASRAIENRWLADAVEERLLRLWDAQRAAPGEPDARIFYGPHPCERCGALIAKAAREDGSEEFDYPSTPIYPNTTWAKHVCSSVARSQEAPTPNIVEFMKNLALANGPNRDRWRVALDAFLAAEHGGNTPSGGPHWIMIRMRSALENWGRHHPWCKALDYSPGEFQCNCGFADALKIGASIIDGPVSAAAAPTPGKEPQ